MIPLCGRCSHGEVTHFGPGGECVVCRRCPGFRLPLWRRIAGRWL